MSHGIIKSGENARFKQINSLSLKKFRDRENLFVVEGEKFVRDIPEGAGIELYAVSEAFAAKKPGFPFRPGVEILCFGDGLFARMSGAVTAQGIMAVCEKPNHCLEDALARGGLIILMDGIGDPGNLGAVLRTAAAASAAGVVVSENSADVYSGKVLRSSASALFSVPFLTGADLAQTIKGLKERGFRVTGAGLSDEAVPLYDYEYTENEAIVIGGEARGISPEIAGLCERMVKIPIAAGVDSLNASVAAGIFIYEYARQMRR